MKEIIIWNDLCLEEHFDSVLDEQLRHLFDRRFDGCQCTYLSKIATEKWYENVPLKVGISIGTRPIKLWKNDYWVRMSRTFDESRRLQGYDLDLEQLSLYKEKNENADELIIHEDAIVEGNSIIYLLDSFLKLGYIGSKTKVMIYAFSSVTSGVKRIKEKYRNTEIYSEYELMGNTDEVWNSTILFVSDMFQKNESGTLFLEDRRRFEQCFYSYYEEVLEQCLKLKMLL